jgi:hypothetical protein
MQRLSASSSLEPPPYDDLILSSRDKGDNAKCEYNPTSSHPHPITMETTYTAEHLHHPVSHRKFSNDQFSDHSNPVNLHSPADALPHERKHKTVRLSIDLQCGYTQDDKDTNNLAFYHSELQQTYGGGDQPITLSDIKPCDQPEPMGWQNTQYDTRHCQHSQSTKLLDICHDPIPCDHNQPMKSRLHKPCDQIQPMTTRHHKPCDHIQPMDTKFHIKSADSNTGTHSEIVSAFHKTQTDHILCGPKYVPDDSYQERLASMAYYPSQLDALVEYETSTQSSSSPSSLDKFWFIPSWSDFEDKYKSQPSTPQPQHGHVQKTFAYDSLSNQSSDSNCSTETMTPETHDIESFETEEEHEFLNSSLGLGVGQVLPEQVALNCDNKLQGYRISGQLLLGIQIDLQDDTLFISVMRCQSSSEDIIAEKVCDWFVTIRYLVDRRGKKPSRRRSPSRHCCADPVFNTIFSYKVDAFDGLLQVELWNNRGGVFRRKKKCGSTYISLNQIGFEAYPSGEIICWYKLLSRK